MKLPEQVRKWTSARSHEPGPVQEKKPAALTRDVTGSPGGQRGFVRPTMQFSNRPPRAVCVCARVDMKVSCFLCL